MAPYRLLFSLPFGLVAALGILLLLSARSATPPTVPLLIAIRGCAIVTPTFVGIWACGLLGYAIIYLVFGPAGDGWGHHVLAYLVGPLGGALLGAVLGAVCGWSLGTRCIADPTWRGYFAAAQMVVCAGGITYAWLIWH